MANKSRSGEREAFWRDVVKRFGTSGLSVRAFCRREKLQESAFYFCRTLADRDGKPSKRPRAISPAFLPVTIRRDSLSQTSGLTLELPSGAVLRFAEAGSAFAAARQAETQ